jgi:hypothetical protein
MRAPDRKMSYDGIVAGLKEKFDATRTNGAVRIVWVREKKRRAAVKAAIEAEELAAAQLPPSPPAPRALRALQPARPSPPVVQEAPKDLSSAAEVRIPLAATQHPEAVSPQHCEVDTLRHTGSWSDAA